MPGSELMRGQSTQRATLDLAERLRENSRQSRLLGKVSNHPCIAHDVHSRHASAPADSPSHTPQPNLERGPFLRVIAYLLHGHAHVPSAGKTLVYDHVPVVRDPSDIEPPLYGSSFLRIPFIPSEMHVLSLFFVGCSAILNLDIAHFTPLFA